MVNISYDTFAAVIVTRMADVVDDTGDDMDDVRADASHDETCMDSNTLRETHGEEKCKLFETKHTHDLGAAIIASNATLLHNICMTCARLCYAHHEINKTFG